MSAPITGAQISPKAHLARMRIAMAGTEDAWLTDAFGEAVLCWTPAPGSGLVAELKRAVKEMRGLLGETAPLTVVFDRGGWSPAAFAELYAKGVDICTYKKSPKTDEPRSSFSPVEVTDAFGHTETYLLADREVELPYDKAKLSFSCRQVTRLDEKTGHQTQVVTSRRDLPAGPLAQAMFGRWTEENFFKYGRGRFELDGLDSYAKLEDDLDRLVPNPDKRAAAAEVRAAKKELELAHSTQGKGDARTVPGSTPSSRARSPRRQRTSRPWWRRRGRSPAKVPLGASTPTQSASTQSASALRRDQDLRLHAETTLSRMLGPTSRARRTRPGPSSRRPTRPQRTSRSKATASMSGSSRSRRPTERVHWPRSVKS